MPRTWDPWASGAAKPEQRTPCPGSARHRLRLGVQSFDDALLYGIGRIHTAAEAEQAFHAARAAGFENISIDLMYGLPGQTLDHLRRSVAAAAANRQRQPKTKTLSKPCLLPIRMII